MALCVFSMSNKSEHTLGLIPCNVLITEQCESRGLGNHKLLRPAALIGRCKRKALSMGSNAFLFFFKMRSPNML